MGFKSVASAVLKTAFPFIATAAEVGGPLGIMAANAVGNALGVKVDPDKIEETITAAQIRDPEAIAKLEQAEHDFKIQAEKLGFEHIQQMEQIAAADRANARAREVAVKDKIPAILAMGITAGFFTLLGLLIFHPVPPESKDVVIALAGVLGTMAVSINGYYFGSSSGSAAKTKILAEERQEK